MMFWDREGKPIDMATWAELRSDPANRIIDRSVLDNGTVVSTVWVGIDLAIAPWDHEPRIFETFVYDGLGEVLAEFSCRAGSEAAAQADHDRLVARLVG